MERRAGDGEESGGWREERIKRGMESGDEDGERRIERREEDVEERRGWRGERRWRVERKDERREDG